MKQIFNPQIYNVTDQRGWTDPLAAWMVDPNHPQYDIIGVYADGSNIYIHSRRHGMVSKSEYQRHTNLHFDVSGTV